VPEVAKHWSIVVRCQK